MTVDLFIKFAAFAFGCILGSFANVCIYRLPKNQNIVFPSSHCPFCKSKIAYYDNIPLLSYVFLRAKCRQCGVYIPFKYFSVEFLSGLAALLLVMKYGLGLLFVVYYAFALALIILSFIDLEHRIIPNSITFPGIAIGLALSYILSKSTIHWEVGLAGSLTGIAVGGGSLIVVGFLYTALTGREGIGFGDVKLLAMFGAFFGWKGAFFAVFIGSVFGLVVSLPIIIAKRTNLKYPIPFGPFLSIGLIIYVWLARDLFEGLLP